MDKDKTEEIQIILDLLKATLIRNNVSLALNGNKICFFDTKTYVENKKFDGFSVDINDLVK